MCGLMLAFTAAAALWHRQREGGVARVDFSMIEAMLWAMAEPLVATQLGSAPKPMGNASTRHAPHGAWRCVGDDDWIGIAVRSDEEWRALCTLVPGLSGMAALDLGQRRDAGQAIDAALTAWADARSASVAAEALLKAGIPAAALARHADLVQSPHLAARAFWDKHGAGVLPGLPWRASFGRTIGPAPDLGADADQVLATVLGLSPDRIVELRKSGALG
jgi:crotonobetainyl-CoA:carnitine CoA-transferase CaiB-like acyl-CoA transferase